jgi:hypothetical protein
MDIEGTDLEKSVRHEISLTPRERDQRTNCRICIVVVIILGVSPLVFFLEKK